MKKVDVEGRVEGIDVEEEGELGLDKLLPGMLDRFHCYRNSLCVAPPERRCGTDLARSGLATVSVNSSHRLGSSCSPQDITNMEVKGKLRFSLSKVKWFGCLLPSSCSTQHCPPRHQQSEREVPVKVDLQEAVSFQLLCPECILAQFVGTSSCV
jgi:hypothetical protein